MEEKLKDVQKKVVDFWNKYNRKQRTLMISIVLALAVFCTVMVLLLNKTEYVVLVECESASQASEVKEELTDAGILYTIDNNWVVRVPEENRVDAEMAIATSGIIAKEYTLEEALDGSISVTEADITALVDVWEHMRGGPLGFF